VLKFLPA
jgi:serine/threonine protein kinase